MGATFGLLDGSVDGFGAGLFDGAVEGAVIGLNVGSTVSFLLDGSLVGVIVVFIAADGRNEGSKFDAVLGILVGDTCVDGLVGEADGARPKYPCKWVGEFEL